jgi:putative SOS response-associated peptidase YedK
MCGRFGLTITQEEMAEIFGAPVLIEDWHPRYNIAPSQEIPVMVAGEVARGVVEAVAAGVGEGISGKAAAKEGRGILSFRWGLVPFWSKDPAMGNRMINARSETVRTQPAFRNAWKRGQRCLILADGFYEWQKPAMEGGPKIPHWIHLPDRRPFGFAGIWERWDGGEAPLFTTTILTRDASPAVRSIHDRMPVILTEKTSWKSWIDPDAPLEGSWELIERNDPGEILAEPVSTSVNRPANEGPRCIES